LVDGHLVDKTLFVYNSNGDQVLFIQLSFDQMSVRELCFGETTESQIFCLDKLEKFENGLDFLKLIFSPKLGCYFLNFEM
jgi:hypothetical protein